MDINLTPFPNLTTERFILRQLKIQDENEIFALRSDLRVNEFLDRLTANSLEDARQFINKINKGMSNNELVYWAITPQDDSKLIGTICYWNFSKEKLRAEIGYELHPHFQGKGIMQEALTKVIEYGFETLKLSSIDAYPHPDNTKSIKLLERNGFLYNRKSENTVIYSLVNNKE